MNEERYSKKAFWRHIEGRRAYAAWACLEKLIQNKHQNKLSSNELEEMKDACSALEESMGRNKKESSLQEKDLPAAFYKKGAFIPNYN